MISAEMILVAHIVIALASLVVAAAAFLAPGRNVLRLSYSLVGGTVASGFYLVLIEPVHILHVCVSGLIYLAIASWGIVAARNKLVRISRTHDGQEKTIL